MGSPQRQQPSSLAAWGIPIVLVVAAGIPGLEQVLQSGLWLGVGILVLVLVRFRWRDKSPKPVRPKRPARAKLHHVAAELETSRQLLKKIRSDITRQALQAKLQQLQAHSQSQDWHVVVFGMASAGKTSLINALLGEPVGAIAPTLGTTKQGSLYTYELPVGGGTVYLTDTPGLQAIGQSGEAEARTLASQADLLIFVVAGDLLASEYQELCQLARLGKRTLLVLNKTDQIHPQDVELILAKLRQRTAGIIAPQHILAIAARPQPLRVRYQQPDLSFQEVEEPQPPTLQPLIDQIITILKKEGSHLRLANTWQQDQNLTQAAQQALRQEQYEQGCAIVERLQWATAAAVSVTPLPAVDLIAAVAIHARMIAELHSLYGSKITFQQASRTAQTLARLLVQLGSVELVTQTLASLLKSSPAALVGIPIQAASAAYLTRIAGLSYLDWLASGTPWQPDSLKERIQTYLKAHSQKAFIQSFLQQWSGPKKPLLSDQSTSAP
ncbi:MAG: GTP-binding protein [Thermostichales cyanobacterium SRBZ-1_bins_19]